MIIKTDDYSLENLDMIVLELPTVLYKEAKLTTKEIRVASFFPQKKEG